MDINRRAFLRLGLSLGGTLALSGCETIPYLVEKKREKVPPYIWGAAPEDMTEKSSKVKIRYSVCETCPSFCGIRAKVREGMLIKIDGNPYHPNSFEPHIPYETDPKDALNFVGSVCVKGQSGIQTLYDPLRVKQPLKRVGPRGSGKWQTISWKQAIEEIVEGGDLFGEGHVKGLKAVRDLDTPIDPDYPEYGPKANQFFFLFGRSGTGQYEFINRFLTTYGTINWVTEQPIGSSSYHVATRLCLDGRVDSLRPDILNCEYLIFFGTSPLEANLPMQVYTRKLMRAKSFILGESETLQEKGWIEKLSYNFKHLKWVVVDPRLSTSASKADQWIPIRPGTDAALALGMA